MTPGDTRAGLGGDGTLGLGTRPRCHLPTYCPSVVWSSGSLSWNSMMSSRLWTYLEGTRSPLSWHPRTEGTPQVTPTQGQGSAPLNPRPPPQNLPPQGSLPHPSACTGALGDTWGHSPCAGGWLREGWHGRTPWHGLTPWHGRILLAAAQDTGQTTRHVVALGEGSRCWHWHRDMALKGTPRPSQHSDSLWHWWPPAGTGLSPEDLQPVSPKGTA